MLEGAVGPAWLDSAPIVQGAELDGDVGHFQEPGWKLNLQRRARARRRISSPDTVFHFLWGELLEGMKIAWLPENL